MTATPWGFRDILPEEAQAREEIACTVKGCFREHHYPVSYTHLDVYKRQLLIGAVTAIFMALFILLVGRPVLRVSRLIVLVAVCNFVTGTTFNFRCV